MDFLVIGGGIAGFQAILSLLPHGTAMLVSKGPLSSGSSYFAQGGLALPWGFTEDDIESHVQDTIRAGAGLCDPAAVRSLIEGGEEAFEGLLRYGVPFDRDPRGQLRTTREAAHSRSRIVHAGGDRTGALILKSLAEAAFRQPHFRFLSPYQIYQIKIDEHGESRGAYFLGERDSDLLEIRARAVILATGGAGSLFLRSTNPRFQRGDGVSVAFRAGCEIERMAYYQFHPTVLDLPGTQPFLLTEAMRGEGAHLLDKKGERFLFRYHPDGELAPRDVVARALWIELSKDQSQEISLSVNHLPNGFVKNRFPQVYGHLKELGIDLENTPVPIRPAAHFQMGGIQTDMTGRTGVKGLWAIGEVASTRVHGANRLASNSLLEALVMGRKITQSILEESLNPLSGGTSIQEARKLSQMVLPDFAGEESWSGLKTILWEKAGIVRTAAGGQEGLEWVEDRLQAGRMVPVHGSQFAFANGLLVAKLIFQDILTAPVAGAHYMSVDSEADRVDGVSS
ncbi:MAG: L-aspartate oxidase [Leptospirales bacterium]